MPKASPRPPARPKRPVLVTGVAGFVGASVARVLRARGVPVLGLDDLSAGDAARLDGLGVDLEVGDVRDGALLARLLAERPRAVLHLAARVGVRRVLAAPGACEAENIAGAEALARALARAAGPAPRLLAASTSEVYAESREPLTETSPLRPVRASGRWRYAASKLRAEGLLDRASAAGPALHLRFFNVVGPGQDGASGMVLPRFVESALAGSALEVYGTGAQVRTFAHVDAAAEDIARLAAPEAFDDIDQDVIRAARGALNLGGTAVSTVLGLAERVVALAGTPAPIVFRDPRSAVSARFEEVDHRVPDLGRLTALGLGRAPWDLAAIVADTLARHRSAGASLGRPPGVQVECASPAS